MLASIQSVAHAYRYKLYILSLFSFLLLWRFGQISMCTLVKSFANAFQTDTIIICTSKEPQQRQQMAGSYFAPICFCKES